MSSQRVLLADGINCEFYFANSTESFKGSSKINSVDVKTNSGKFMRAYQEPEFKGVTFDIVDDGHYRANV